MAAAREQYLHSLMDCRAINQNSKGGYEKTYKVQI